jgi:tRNA-Thr(GGU) m(6)t(6)A37 methyltransferase TsaA
MNEQTDDQKQAYQIHPIGHIQRPGDSVHLELLAPFRPALRQLDRFSHVIVLWWADQHDNEESRSIMQCRPPYAEDKVTGIFACRSEYRPNPIAMTTCKILEVDEEQGIVQIANIDAYEGTPILDLKGYFPVCDRVKEASIPEWIPFQYEWMPDEGLGLEY